MTNREIADILGEMGTILELLGENPFKCRAFHNAARVLGASTVDLRSAAEAGTLTGIPGIGKGLAPIVADLVLRGTSGDYEKLRKSVPRGLLDLLKIQGVGEKSIQKLRPYLTVSKAK